MRHAPSSVVVLILCSIAAAIVVIVAPPSAAASPFTDAVDALEPGEWVELSTEDIAVLGVGAHAGNSIPYAQSAVWDPVTDTLHFIGIDHGGGNMHHYTYGASTNVWTDRGAIPALAHGYEHIAIDVAARRLYHRVYALGVGPEQHRILVTPLDVATDAWSDITPFPDSYAQVAIAMVHVPGAGLVVYNCGEIGGQIAIMDATGAWTTDLRGFGGTSRYSCIAEHSPAHDLMVIGGGGGDSQHLWRLDPDGTVTALPDAPIGVGTSYSEIGHQGNVTADPNTGTFLVIGDRQFWALDARGAGEWRRLPDPDLSRVYDDEHMISAAASDHGVVVYVTCQASACRTFLYRHAPGSGVVVPDFDAGVGPRDDDAGIAVPGSDAGPTARDEDAGPLARGDGGAGMAMTGDGGRGATVPDASRAGRGLEAGCACRAVGGSAPSRGALLWALALASLVSWRASTRARASVGARRRAVGAADAALALALGGCAADPVARHGDAGGSSRDDATSPSRDGGPLATIDARTSVPGSDSGPSTPRPDVVRCVGFDAPADIAGGNGTGESADTRA